MKSIALIFTLFLLLFSASCTEKVTPQNQLVTQVEWKKIIAETPAPQVVDVRTPDEFSQGHLQDAINVDFYAQDFMEQMNQFDKERPVFLYCHSGGRSGKASDMLFESGFTQIYDLQGGYSSWKK